MLYLNRKPGDAVIINQTIEVKVIEIRGKTVKLGFDFPPEASVLRAELIDQVKAANRKAIDAAQVIGDLDHPKTSAVMAGSKKTTRTP